jgi:hypothetical protein
MNLNFYFNFNFELNSFSVSFLFPARALVSSPGRSSTRRRAPNRCPPLSCPHRCRPRAPARECAVLTGPPSLHLLPRSAHVSDPPFPSPRMPPALAFRGRRSPDRLFPFPCNTAPPRAPHLLLNRLRFCLIGSGHRRSFLRASFRPSTAAVRHHR